MKNASVLLTAGFDRANHVLCLAELLHREGIHIAGFVVVSPYSAKRLKALIRQRGKTFLWEAIPRLLGKGKGPQKFQSPDGIDLLMQENNIAAGSLKKWAQQKGVPYKLVKSINAPDAVQFVKQINPDWVAYGGGGILHNAFIDAAGGKVLNAHSGPLPEIRGMNACEWSLLLGHEPAITIHFINRGIDTGGQISRHKIRVEPGDSIDVLRSRCVAMGVEALKQTILHPPTNLVQPEQNASSHRQCFVLAPAMKELLNKRLEKEDQLAFSSPVSKSNVPA